MRYSGKIYLHDVLDQVIVSGYVVDCDPLSSPDHEAYEFAWQVPGTGENDPLTWLLLALGRASIQAATAPAKKG